MSVMPRDRTCHARRDRLTLATYVRRSASANRAAAHASNASKWNRRRNPHLGHTTIATGAPWPTESSSETVGSAKAAGSLAKAHSEDSPHAGQAVSMTPFRSSAAKITWVSNTIEVHNVALGRRLESTTRNGRKVRGC
jgi:hypothetical protein